MEPERWDRIEKVVAAALELPAEQRNAYIGESCGDDSELRGEVEELLAGQTGAEAFLESPAFCLSGRAGGDEQAVDDPLIGRVIGPYRVEGMLGSGGMGSVYLASRVDEEFDQRVAVKVLHPGPAGDAIRSRFRTERQILASLDHPHIARLLDGGTTDDDRPCLVMEYVEGVPLDEFCRERGLGVRQRVELFLQVCDAVSFAHRSLVVHRDIKPRNVLVTEDGQAKLLDFGIAKLLDPTLFPLAEEVTRAGTRPMSPHFASPEQIRGQPITTASDVFSLGVVLYELLSGELPRRFEDVSLASMERQLAREPLPPSVVASEAAGEAGIQRLLAGDLDAIVLKALREEPGQRYASVGELAEDLRRHLQGLPVTARRGTFAYRASRFLRRHRLPVGVVVGVAAVVLGSALALALQARRIASERDRAERVAEFTASILGEASPVSGSGTDSVREVLERSARKIDLEFTDQPETQAELLLAVGQVYNELGMYLQAEPLLLRSVELREEFRGSLLRKLPQSLSELGYALDELGEGDEALRLLERALAVAGRQLGQEHEDVVVILQRLGKAHRGRSEFADAVAYYRQANEIGVAVYGRDHPMVAKGLSELAYVLCEMGEFEESERLHGEAIAVYEKSGEAHRAGLANALAALGVLYWKTGRLDVAVQEIERALHIREAVFDEFDPVIGSTLGDLANVQADRGELGTAEALLRRCLAIQLRGMGEDSLAVLATRHNLSMLLLDLGRLAEARQESLAVLAGHRRVHEEGSVWAAYTLRTVSLAEHYLGLDRDAAEHDRESLEIVGRFLGEDHPEMAAGLGVSARIRLGRGDLAGAEQLLRELLEPAEDDDDPWWRWRAANHMRLAELLITTDRLDEAALELDRARSILERSLPAEPSRSDRLSLVRLGITRGDLDHALGLSERATAGWKEALAALDGRSSGSVSVYHRLLRIALVLRLGRAREAGADADQLIALGWQRPEWLELARDPGAGPKDVRVVLY